jgi:hypothetical protein
MNRLVKNEAKSERLRFLCRVVKKEIHHLSYSAEKVFKKIKGCAAEQGR